MSARLFCLIKHRHEERKGKTFRDPDTGGAMSLFVYNGSFGLEEGGGV